MVNVGNDRKITNTGLRYAAKTVWNLGNYFFEGKIGM